MDLHTSYQHCLELARAHYENFPTASRLIKRDLRPAVAAIYAFARTADDIADEGNEPADKRLKQLDAWEVLLDRCKHEEVDHPVFLALGDAIRKHDLPVGCLHDLLTAFRMDVSIHAYDQVDELLFYCRHSANPVGRLILALHGINSAQAISASDDICTALQLANFWQDLSRDLPNGRCYLPNEWLQQAELASSGLLQSPLPDDLDARLDPVIQHAVSFTEAMMLRGRTLLVHLPLRLRLQIAATTRGGLAILKQTGGACSLHQRPKLAASSWFGMLPLILLDTLLPPSGAARQASEQAKSTS